MKITYVSKHGKNKQNSQDCLLLNDSLINNSAGRLDARLDCICIADGVGGVPGGFEASSYILENFSKHPQFINCAELRDFLIKLNDSLIEYSSSFDDMKTMATTFSGLIAIDRSLWLMHAGNTRIYAYTNGKLELLTKDHTKGERNIIYCCFGTGKREYLKDLQLEEVKLDSIPEFLMLTSDGVHDYIEDGRLEQLLADNFDDRNKILEIIRTCEEGGSMDDSTVVIARMGI